MDSAPLDRPTWLASRRQGIGGSDVAAILGISPWRTPLDVYLDKTGQSQDAAETPAMRWGTLLEPVMLDEFERTTGLSVERNLPMLASQEHPHMLANLDGVASDGAIVECKTSRSADGWGEIGSADIPPHYQTQVAHYLAVTGATSAWVPVLIGASDFRIYQVHRDEPFIADLIEAERDFWQGHVLAGIPPEPINARDAARLWARDNGTSLEASPSVATQITEYKSLKAQIAALTAQADTLSDALRISFGEAASLTYNDKVLATYKAADRTTLDTTALKKAHPELAAQFSRITTSRTLLIK